MLEIFVCQGFRFPVEVSLPGICADNGNKAFTSV